MRGWGRDYSPTKAAMLAAVLPRLFTVPGLAPALSSNSTTPLHPGNQTATHSLLLGTSLGERDTLKNRDPQGEGHPQRQRDPQGEEHPQRPSGRGTRSKTLGDRGTPSKTLGERDTFKYPQGENTFIDPWGEGHPQKEDTFKDPRGEDTLKERPSERDNLTEKDTLQ